MRRIALIVTTAALWWPTAAAAHHRAHHAAYHPRPNPIMAAYTIAANYWHASPCHNEVKFVYAPAWDGDEWTSMWAEPWACTIGISSTFWTDQHQMAVDMWPDFAVLMIHEVGHLLGYEHSTDPMNVMYPSPGDKLAVTGLTLWR